MKQYYYFVTSLPKITYFDAKLPILQETFISELKDIIGTKDIICLEALRYHFDNINFINLLEEKNEDWIPFGIFSKEELEVEIKDPQHIPNYMKVFLEKKEYNERINPDLTLENELTIYYYNYLQTLPYPFLKKYINLDFDLKNIATAISSRNFKLDRKQNILPLHELSDKLINNNSSDFGLTFDYDWLENYLEEVDNLNIYEKELKLIEIRFDFLDNELNYDYFSFNQIISFYIKLFLLNRKIGFNELKGQEIFEKVTNDLSADENIFKDLDN